MAPPPKPPVICYDLYSDMPRVRRRQLDSLPQVPRTIYTRPASSAVMMQAPPPQPRHQYFDSNAAASSPTTTPFYIKCVKNNSYNTCTNTNQIRHEYGERLRREQEEKARLKAEIRLHQSMRQQIEMLTAKLDSVKRAQDHMSKQYGMSHNAAKYMQEKEEEISKLRKQIEQCSEMRQRDALKHAKQLKELMMKQKEKSAEKRSLKNLTNLTHCKRPVSGAIRSSTPNSLSSPAHSTSSSSANTGSQPTTNSQGSTTSSTISLSSSSCSSASSMSSCRRKAAEDETLSRGDNFTPRDNHFIKTPQLARRANRHVTINATPFKTPPSHIPTPPSLFFHTAPLDNDTLEVTDINFFDKVEDKTMMEMNGLMHRVKSTLKEVQRL